MTGFLYSTFTQGVRIVLMIGVVCSLSYGEIKFVTPPIALPSLGFATSEPYAEIATSDFNGDGYLDVVIPFGRMSGAIKLDIIAEVFLSTGPRTFAKNKITLPNASYLIARSAIIADFNGDGIDDFGIYSHLYNSSVAGNYRSEAYQLVTYLTQRGTNSTIFIKGPVIPLSIGSHDIKVVDTNGDGLPDITAILPYASMGSVDGHLTVRNSGGGRFASSWVKTHGKHFSTMFQLLGDFNFDGQLDAILTGDYYPSGIGSTSVPKTYLISNLNDAEGGVSGPKGVEAPGSQRLRANTKAVLVSQNTTSRTSRVAVSVGTSVILYDVDTYLNATLLSSGNYSDANSQGYLKTVCPIGTAGDNIILASNGPLKFFSTLGGMLSLQSSITVKFDWNASIQASKELGFDTSNTVIDNNRIVAPDGIVCRDMDHDGILDIVFASFHGGGILYGSK